MEKILYKRHNCIGKFNNIEALNLFLLSIGIGFHLVTCYQRNRGKSSKLVPKITNAPAEIINIAGKRHCLSVLIGMLGGICLFPTPLSLLDKGKVEEKTNKGDREVICTNIRECSPSKTFCSMLNIVVLRKYLW